MTAVVCAGAGFLIAVLWFDLMFDVQARGREPDAAALASIGAYYRRVTTTARPMTFLVGAVMLATLAAVVVQVARGEDPAWAAWASLAAIAAAIVLVTVHTLPAAVRLGAAGDAPAEGWRIARAVLRDHLACLVLMLTILALQLAALA